MVKTVSAQGPVLSPAWRAVSLFLFGPAFALSVFLIANHGSFIIDENRTSELVWTIIAYIVGEHLARIIDRAVSEREASTERKEVQALIRSTADLFRAEVRSSLHVSRLSDETFMSRIESSLRSAHHVRNTYVGISDLTGHGTPQGNRILQLYADVLSRDKAASWYDVVGIKELFERRFVDINPDNKARFLGTHVLHVIDTHAPILNFILIGQKDAPLSEVYFGWIVGPNADTERFYSHDTRLIRMFENYFESLRSARNVVARLDIPYRDAPENRFLRSASHRWRGTWLSISGYVKALPEANSPANRLNYEVSEYALVQIDYDYDWKVTGDIYELSGQRKYTFESEMCSIVENSLYYKFYNKSRYGETQSEGLGSYSLADDENSLMGHYSRKPYNKASITRAMKITAEQALIIQKGGQAGEALARTLIAPILAMPLEKKV